MKIPIFTKLITITLFLIIVPVMIVGFLSVRDLGSVGGEMQKSISELGTTATTTSSAALNDLAAKIITQKAVDVAKQVEIYLKDHPKMTIKDLQADSYFQGIAVQSVGQKGYTALTDVDTLTCRFHKSPKIVNMDLSGLATPYPGFWGIMSKTKGGVPAEGFYKWMETSGDLKGQETNKYMYIAIVNGKTADDVTLSVAATTYVDEFSKPAVDTEAKIKGTLDSVVTFTTQKSEETRTRSLLILAAVMFIALIATYLFSKAITNPLKKLKKAGEEIAAGNLDIDVSTGESYDEIGDLSKSFEQMVIKLREAREEKERAFEIEQRSRSNS
jgi:HAMP domain-containing protein